jgi:hypothetical protein
LYRDYERGLDNVLEYSPRDYSTPTSFAPDNVAEKLAGTFVRK